MCVCVCVSALCARVYVGIVCRGEGDETERTDA